MSRTKRQKTMRPKHVKPDWVRDSVDWLWKNEMGCCHFKSWVEPDWMEDISKYDYNIDRNPHSGREWCIVIGWHDYGKVYEGDEKDLFVQDGHWVIQAGIRFQDWNNGMQCDYDVDWTIPNACNGFGDLYDLSVSIPRKVEGGYRTVAKWLNQYVDEMFAFWKEHHLEA